MKSGLANAEPAGPWALAMKKKHHKKKYGIKNSPNDSLQNYLIYEYVEFKC